MTDGLLGVPSSVLNKAKTNLIAPTPEPEPLETTTKIPEGLPTINFGSKNVSILHSNEMIYENGSSTVQLSLSNGILININSEPKEEDGMKFHITSGTFEFRTPDSFSYIIQFNADPKNFNLTNFERRNKFLQRANPKLLAALAGR